MSEPPVKVTVEVTITLSLELDHEFSPTSPYEDIVSEAAHIADTTMRSVLAAASARATSAEAARRLVIESVEVDRVIGKRA